MLPGIMQMLAAGTAVAAPATISWNSPASSSGAAIASGSFTMNTGTAAAGRFIVVGFVDNASGVTACTIGGITATKAVGVSSINSANCSLWGAVVPTGTTATVSFTLSGTSSGIAAMAWTINGLSSTTPVDTRTVTHVTTGSVSTPSASTLAGGVAIAVGASDANSANTLSTSGGLGTTSDASFQYAVFSGCSGNDNYNMLGVHGTTSGAGVAQTLNCNITAVNLSACIATWR